MGASDTSFDPFSSNFSGFSYFSTGFGTLGWNMVFRRTGTNEFENVSTGETFEIRGSNCLPITEAMAIIAEQKTSPNTLVVKNPGGRSNHYIIFAQSRSRDLSVFWKERFA